MSNRDSFIVSKENVLHNMTFFGNLMLAEPHREDHVRNAFQSLCYTTAFLSNGEILVKTEDNVVGDVSKRRPDLTLCYSDNIPRNFVEVKAVQPDSEDADMWNAIQTAYLQLCEQVFHSFQEHKNAGVSQLPGTIVTAFHYCQLTLERPNDDTMKKMSRYLVIRREETKAMKQLPSTDNPTVRHIKGQIEKLRRLQALMRIKTKLHYFSTRWLNERFVPTEQIYNTLLTYRSKFGTPEAFQDSWMVEEGRSSAAVTMSNIDDVTIGTGMFNAYIADEYQKLKESILTHRPGSEEEVEIDEEVEEVERRTDAMDLDWSAGRIIPARDLHAGPMAAPQMKTRSRVQPEAARATSTTEVTATAATTGTTPDSGSSSDAAALGKGARMAGLLDPKRNVSLADLWNESEFPDFTDADYPCSEAPPDLRPPSPGSDLENNAFGAPGSPLTPVPGSGRSDTSSPTQAMNISPQQHIVPGSNAVPPRYHNVYEQTSPTPKRGRGDGEGLGLGMGMGMGRGA